jgi:hypothetical protein
MTFLRAVATRRKFLGKFCESKKEQGASQKSGEKGGMYLL